jgi:hypothetical protein
MASTPWRPPSLSATERRSQVNRSAVTVGPAGRTSSRCCSRQALHRATERARITSTPLSRTWGFLRRETSHLAEIEDARSVGMALILTR